MRQVVHDVRVGDNQQVLDGHLSLRPLSGGQVDFDTRVVPGDGNELLDRFLGQWRAAQARVQQDSRGIDHRP